MGADSKIEWTDHTFNPWWGCVKVSPACAHCYAEALAKRTGHAVWGENAPRRFFGEKHWDEVFKWALAAHRAGTRRRVFCGSMCDWLEDRPELVEPRNRLLGLIEETEPSLDWLLLSKRPENASRLTSDLWNDGWPRNAWLGVTVESQDYLWRVAEARKAGAPVLFVSYEPALGPVDFGEHLVLGRWDSVGRELPKRGIDWLIVGGESGHGARPFDVAWARSAIEQCKAAGVPVFVKQLGAYAILDPRYDRSISGATRMLRDRKGGDPDEWPEGLRVREWPR